MDWADGTQDIEDGTLFGDGSKKPVREYDGSCHCGQIEWTVRLESPKSILCHCRTCQILSGGPYSCNQIIHKVWKPAWMSDRGPQSMLLIYLGRMT